MRNFRVKNFDIREEETGSFSSMQPCHATRHYGTELRGDCWGGGRIGGWCWRHAEKKEVKRRIGGFAVAVSSGYALLLVC